MHAFLSNDWAGMAIAACVALIAAGLYFWLRKRWLSVPIGVLALIMAIGSAVHLFQVSAMEDRYPAPGRFAQVQGQDIHYLAEGSENGGPTIVLFGGGHAPGTSVQFLHDALKEDYRSILIDRPGMGWSGKASFPIATHTEAQQMWEVLDAAGAKGPFLLGGHSLGGLLAANMARLRPEEVHSLVLMDATPTDVLVYGPRLDELSAMKTVAWWTGFAQLFGIDLMRLAASQEQPEYYAQLEKKIAQTMGPEADAIQKAYAKRPRAQFAAHSIFGELSPAGMASVGYETGFFSGELGDMPLYLFAPKNSVGLTEVTAFDNADEREEARMQMLYATVRERYLDYSDNSIRIVAPEGTGHNFIYEAPDFTIDVLRQIASGTYEEPSAQDSEESADTAGEAE